VLVVDDDDRCTEALVELGRVLALRVVAAPSGLDALIRLRRGLRPCLILVDLRMPDMDGVDFRRRQLTDPTLAAIPVAMMSGWPAEEDARTLGMTFLQKPIEPTRLVELVADRCGIEGATAP
jgi:two-component system, chemotaxis family, chemotaxis protein CheY